MTARKLLESLQSLDEKDLDLPVVVIPDDNLREVEEVEVDETVDGWKGVQRYVFLS